MESNVKKNNNMMMLAIGGVVVVVVVIIIIVVATSGKSSSSSPTTSAPTVIVNVTTAAPTPSALVKTVLLERPGSDQPINLGEVTLYDDKDVKIPASNLTVSIAPVQHPDFGPGNLVDNNPDTFGHAGGDLVGQNFKFVLTNPMKIKRIVIMNRTSCCQDRIATVAVRTLNSNDVELSKTVLTGASMKYELTYNPSSGAYLSVSN